MARILIADDERDIRDLIAFTLEFSGHEVIATANGEDAYQHTLIDLPDLILLDVRMPLRTGYEVCDLVKANEATRHIPIVFLSAKGQDSEIREGLVAGAEEYILKPFSPEDLTNRVRKILAEAHR